MEYIHDTLVAKLWPGSDPISPGEYRDRGLIESAVSRPFHSAFGVDLYPSVTEKAAALFHSLISNHPFHNGNKRTAVVSLDQFLLANGCYLLLSNEAAYVLSEHTASYRERGLGHARVMGEICEVIEEMVVPLSELRTYAKHEPEFRATYRSLTRARTHIRRNPSNRLIPSSH